MPVPAAWRALDVTATACATMESGTWAGTCSSDATLEGVQQLRGFWGERLTVVEIRTPAYLQEAIVATLVRQLAAAAGAMALLVTAFSLFTDALRDALDPKLK